MNAISCVIKGNFGFFHWNKTKGDRRITNLFISRTEVLGILGAIVGLEGYSQRMFREKNNAKIVPTFFEVLKGLDISIIPQKEPVFFEDHLIHREMNHINSKGPLQVEMTGLVKPIYRIIIAQGAASKEIYDKICTYLLNEWAEYIPYLGKNQFPMELEHAQEETLVEIENVNKTIIHSLYKQKDIRESAQVRRTQLLKNDIHYSDNLKDFDKENTPKIISEQTIWSSFPVAMSIPVYMTQGEEHIVFL